MAVPRKMSIALVIFGLLSCNIFFTSLASSHEFLQCLAATVPPNLVYQQSSGSFTSVLQSSVQNPKFATNTTVRPLCVVTASDVTHVQAAVRCGRRHGVRLRVRSGGHDYEGLSYRSVLPEEFAVLDLSRLRAVRVVKGATTTAWVDAGATLGEVYYAVGTVNPGFAFPAGVCPTVGVGGYLGGGGIGVTMRKYGNGGDNVVDAKIVTADGELLDGRAAMGDDLFWAIRGGGGESFGVVVAYQLKLSAVPSTVTVFNVVRTVDQGVAGVLAKWENTILDPLLPDDLTIRVVLQGKQALFQALFLGRCSRLAFTMRAVFPELGMMAADCREMSWMRAMTFISFGNEQTPPEAMLNRTNNLGGAEFKGKSDYVRCAVGEAGWATIYGQWLTPSAATAGLIMILEPHGGKVGTWTADDATPYPHRQGVLFNIQYGVSWPRGADSSGALWWIHGFEAFLAQFVTSNPREAFANYRDLDLGQNVVGADGVTTYESGRVWGERYFMGNFQKLAAVKARVDPSDYFRNEQSIPPLR